MLGSSTVLQFGMFDEAEDSLARVTGICFAT